MVYVQTCQHRVIRLGSFALMGMLAVVGLFACARDVPRYSSGLSMGDQGHAAEVVFESPMMVAALPEGVKIATWRDDSLNIRDLPSTYDQAAWPGRYRPSLDNIRRLNLRQQNESIWYFRDEGYQFRGHRSRW